MGCQEGVKVFNLFCQVFAWGRAMDVLSEIMPTKPSLSDYECSLGAVDN